MKKSIEVLEVEIIKLQKKIKASMKKTGNYDNKLELEIGEHLTAISKLI